MVNKCGCSKKETGKTKDIDVETMVTPDDFGRMENMTDGVVDEEELGESVVKINPDVESMDSRG